MKNMTVTNIVGYGIGYDMTVQDDGDTAIITVIATRGAVIEEGCGLHYGDSFNVMEIPHVGDVITIWGAYLTPA